MANFRGAFHLHSSYSYDSKITLPQMAELLQAKGYSFALMSEHAHDRAKKKFISEQEFGRFIEDCRKYSSSQFLLIPGLEFACYENKVHIVVTPLNRPFSLEGLDTAEKILSAARRENALAVFVHPFFGNAHRLLKPEEFSQVQGIEVWNYNYQLGSGPSLREYSQLRQWLESSRKKAFAGLDLHQPQKLRAVGMDMALTELKQELIFEKIREGNYRLFAMQRTFDSRGRIQNLPLHCLRRQAHLFGRIYHKLAGFKARILHR